MIARRLLVPLAALLVTSCSLVAEHRDWAFVQSVGGMAFGTPYRTPSGVLLPVSVDVSGLKTITTRPRLMNSGVTLADVVVRREGHTVTVALMTRATGGRDDRTSSGDVSLGDLDAGRYAVVYAGPYGDRVDLGEITVPP